ncbi:hypothetical protein ACIBJF_17085 [Streptomyces sp. NPDC050743]|uniref:hypothetical protein n=1 Tax=Streptomyces sp. NPDC050743 TaxID=3365634 RepID=UPI00378AE343
MTPAEYLTASGQGTEVYQHPTIPPVHVVGEIRSGVLAVMGTAEAELPELKDPGSGVVNPGGGFRETALDVGKIAKVVAGHLRSRR